MARHRDKLKAEGARPWFNSIRFRLTMWYLAILALVLFVFGSIVYTSQAQNMSTELRDNLRTDAGRLASTYNPVDGSLALPQGKIGLQPNDIVLAVSVDGHVYQQLGQLDQADLPKLIESALSTAKSEASYGPDTAQILQKLDAAKKAGEDVAAVLKSLNAVPLVGGASDVFFEASIKGGQKGAEGVSRDYLFYATPIVAKNMKLGILVIGRLREDEARLGQLLLTLLLAAPATLLLTAVGGYWLAGRAMRPVRDITRAAREIGETELSRRLNLRTSDELGELANTFDGMLDRLEGAFERQRQFTADASHELRTPLTIVDLEVNHALAAPRHAEEYRRALKTIQTENECMSRLVNDLLVLARADAGRVDPAREEVDLSDVVLEVAERLDPLARRNGVALQVGALPELRVNGDRLYLGQMVANLLENAIKYGRRDTGDNRVRVETGSTIEGDEPRAWVRIEDHGPGIPEEHLPHLFDRFYRVDKARTRDFNGDRAKPEEGEPTGSGLGLSIVQWAAKAHGGSVLVESRPGSGAVFEVRLPLADGCAA